mgnify:FL=1
MSSDFKEIEPGQITDNAFKLIGTDWMLITAGTPQGFNTMTANWGGLGYLWNKKVCFCFIRPQRHTYDFVEKEDTFTLSFFDEKHRDILNFCGAKSGRDVNKVKETGLVPVHSSSGGIYFDQARLVLECKKIYFQDVDERNFLDQKIETFYPNKDYHRMYIGEVVRCLVR